MRRTIRLNEGQLSRIIKDSIKRVLNESDYQKKGDTYFCKDYNGYDIQYILNWNDEDECWNMEAIDRFGNPIDNNFESYEPNMEDALDDAASYIRNHEMI